MQMSANNQLSVLFSRLYIPNKELSSIETTAAAVLYDTAAVLVRQRRPCWYDSGGSVVWTDSVEWYVI